MHRWRFKVTEWRLGKLQWGQDAPPPLPAEQPRHPNPTQSLSICAGQEGFQKHGISTDYAVSVQPEALHGSKALHRGVPSSVLVSVYGKPPGRLVHILPSFLQHLARCSAAQIAVEDLSGDVRSFRYTFSPFVFNVIPGGIASYEYIDQLCSVTTSAPMLCPLGRKHPIKTLPCFPGSSLQQWKLTLF
eukprot:scaffold24586_cov20-Tisochrysis_lutea.AAC.1